MSKFAWEAQTPLRCVVAAALQVPTGASAMLLRCLWRCKSKLTAMTTQSAKPGITRLPRSRQPVGAARRAPRTPNRF